MILKIKVLILYLLICFVINAYLFVKTDWFNNNKDVSTFEKIIDSIYYSLTSASSAGFGDIHAIHMYSRIIVSIQLLGLILLSFDIFIYYLQKR
jgi:hypothetical protein